MQRDRIRLARRRALGDPPAVDGLSGFRGYSGSLLFTGGES